MPANTSLVHRGLPQTSHPLKSDRLSPVWMLISILGLFASAFVVAWAFSYGYPRHGLAGLGGMGIQLVVAVCLAVEVRCPANERFRRGLNGPRASEAPSQLVDDFVLKVEDLVWKIQGLLPQRPMTAVCSAVGGLSAGVVLF